PKWLGGTATIVPPLQLEKLLYSKSQGEYISREYQKPDHVSSLYKRCTKNRQANDEAETGHDENLKENLGQILEQEKPHDAERHNDHTGPEHQVPNADLIRSQRRSDIGNRIPQANPPQSLRGQEQDIDQPSQHPKADGD